jgi:hypothetical protein
MFNAEVLTFNEFAMQEPLPLATIQTAVLDFLRDRDDTVIFGAQAVNAYDQGLLLCKQRNGYKSDRKFAEISKTTTNS